jgi:hypothetical protein
MIRLAQLLISTNWLAPLVRIDPLSKDLCCLTDELLDSLLPFFNLEARVGGRSSAVFPASLENIAAARVDDPRLSRQMRTVKTREDFKSQQPFNLKVLLVFLTCLSHLFIPLASLTCLSHLLLGFQENHQFMVSCLYWGKLQGRN